MPSPQNAEEEEDYMSMTFTPTAPTAPETSLQRRLRQRREAEARARPKSKAELAAEEESRREAALSTSLFTNPSSAKSKGLSMMAKMGFKGGALGKPKPKSNEGDDHRVTEPIKISVKDGREGIGLESEKKRKMREEAQKMGEQMKKAKVDEEGYRERVRREREDARLERLVGAAQKVVEGMEEEEADKVVEGRRAGLRGVPVVYRGLIKEREARERERRMKKELEVAVNGTKLPGYEDDDEDEDDRRALGKTEKGGTLYETVDEEDEEDEELDEFNALPPGERLEKVVVYLRKEHRYCFWCKYKYPDAEMDGCPGLTEEDHD